MEKKAKFISVIPKGYVERFNRHAWEYTDLLYEYRGHQYIVTRYNNGALDSLPEQHKREQAKIDEMIEDAGKPVEPWKYEGSALEAFDKFYESLDN